MIRTTLLLLLALAGGCGEYNSAPEGIASRTHENPGLRQHVSAFDFDEEAGMIYLDTRIPPRQRQRFDIGLGSITLETVEVKNSTLTFQYTPEVEGGYTIYECSVPVSQGRITVKVNPDGTPGRTSFDLAECRVVKTGDVHGE